MALTFRQCTSADLDLLSRLILDWHGIEKRPVDPAGARHSLARLLNDSRLGHAWIIELGGFAAGYTMLTFSDPALGGEPRCYVAALYLEPAHRARGLGRRALSFLQDVARWLHVPLHNLDTEREQKHAALLYRPSDVAVARYSTPETRAVA